MPTFPVLSFLWLFKPATCPAAQTPRLRSRLASGLLAGLLGLMATAARAQALAPAPIPGLPFWQWQVGQPTGYRLLGQHVFNDSTLVAVGGHGTAVKTSNGGRSWQVLPTGVNRALTSVSFADAQTGWIGSETVPATALHYLAGAGRVLRTTTGGQSWVAQSIGDTKSVVSPQVVAVSPTEAYVAYYQTGRHPVNFLGLPQVPMLRHTTNGGSSWSLLASALTPTSTYLVDIVFPTAATGFIVSGSPFAGALRRTTDHGQTWLDVTPGTGNGGVAGFRPYRATFLDTQQGWVVGFVSNLASSALFRTSDGGQTWTAVPVPSPLEYFGISFADPNHGSLIGPNTRYATADGGQTWASVEVPASLLFEQRMRLLPSGAGWSVGANGGLFATTDFGQSWQSRAAQPPVGYVSALGFPSPTHGWALPFHFHAPTLPAVLRTTSRGATWQRQDLSALISPTGRLLGGAFPDADTAWVSGTSSDSFSGLVLHTTDGGRNWAPQQLPTDGNGGVPSLESMAAWDTRRLIAVSNNGSVYVTRNGGQQWMGPTRPVASRRRVLQQATWADSATVYITTDSTVFLKSTNAGRSWQQLPLPASVRLGFSQAITFTSAQVGYFAQSSDIWKTMDGGQSWARTGVTHLGSDFGSQKTPALAGLSFRTARAGWAFGTNDVLQTTDAGQTWSHVAYVGGHSVDDAGGAPTGVGPSVLVDRYNAFGSGTGVSRYSEKYVQADTTLTQLAYCAGESLSLPFTTTGSFAGESHFLVQLSNAMGRFRPGQTRTVGSGSASPLALTLPADLPPGSHYRLRVIQRDSLVLGGDNGYDLLITAPAPTATLARLPAGPLQASLPTGAAPPARYEWTRDGQPVPGQTGAQLTSPAAGSYQVRACTAACCGPWSAALAVVPDLVVSSPQNVQGTYGNVTITGPTTGGAGTATLTGPLTVLGALSVEAGGTLRTACQPLSGTGSFALADGATLHVCDPAGISPTGAVGAVQVSGARTFSPAADYVYDGAQAQLTGPGLPAQVRNLTVDNAGAGLTLSQALALGQVLRLRAGDLTTNGQALTLLSDTSGTALLDNTGGVVRGQGTMQRSLDTQNPAGRGYRHYSAPVSNTTLADLAAPGYAPVLNSAYNTAAAPGRVTPFPTLFGYEQSRLTTAARHAPAFDRGWYAPASLATAMRPGQGFTAHVANGVLVDFTGTFTNGPVSCPDLDRGPQAQAGWHLLGNPYPSPLDWSRVLPAERPGMDAAAYVFQSTGAYRGTYRAYINGLGDPLVAAGSGFFVRTSLPGGRGSVRLTNAHRVTEFGPQPAFGRPLNDLRPQLELRVHGAGGTDGLTLYLQAGATTGVDAEYDATKLANPTGLNLAALAGPTAQAQAIAGLPLLGAAEVVVPLALDVPAAGRYRFEVAALAHFGTATVYLHDALSGTHHVLVAGQTYAFTLAGAGSGHGRFRLGLRPAGVLAGTGALAADAVQVYPNPARGHFTLRLPPVAGVAEGQATLHNALGQEVRRLRVPLTAGGGQALVDGRGLPPGVYLLRVQVGHQVVRHRLVLE